jgi:signal transduction histidine kinase
MSVVVNGAMEGPVGSSGAAERKAWRPWRRLAWQTLAGGIMGVLGATVARARQRRRRRLIQGVPSDQVLAIVAHELRTPVAAIQYAVAALPRTEEGGGDATSACRIIDRQAHHLGRLLDDLADLALLMDGTATLNREVVSLGEVALDAIEATRGLIVARNQALHVSVPEAAVWLHGDPTRLAQVVSNLLTNAAKFTPCHGRIELTVRRDGDDAVLIVKDSGVGIEAEMLSRVFDRFTRGAAGSARGGLGVGLALVRAIVTLHGGTASILSEGPGRGTELIIRLPVDLQLRRARSVQARGSTTRSVSRTTR